LSDRFVPYGNYFLEPSLLGKRPVVFSVGVGQDITFDRALLERHEVDLHLFDPTPVSQRYIAAQDLPKNLKFSPFAVTNYDGKVDLYSDDLENNFEQASSVSIFQRGVHGEKFSAECRTIPSLMKERNISHLDVLKLDIEGAALQVLADTLDHGIFPTQIACEFERPETLKELYVYLKDLAHLFARLEEAGYSCFRTREADKGCQIEIVAIRTRTAESAVSAPVAATAG
jgi:FkbM family methyltransferase